MNKPLAFSRFQAIKELKESQELLRKKVRTINRLRKKNKFEEEKLEHNEGRMKEILDTKVLKWKESMRIKENKDKMLDELRQIRQRNFENYKLTQRSIKDSHDQVLQRKRLRAAQKKNRSEILQLLREHEMQTSLSEKRRMREEILRMFRQKAGQRERQQEEEERRIAYQISEELLNYKQLKEQNLQQLRRLSEQQSELKQTLGSKTQARLMLQRKSNNLRLLNNADLDQIFKQKWARL